MITGGYNIIDFEGEQFSINETITVDSSIVDKLKDITKPCVVGNLYVNSDDHKAFVAPIFTVHFIFDGSHNHNIGELTLSVTGDTTIKFGA